jgi:hypothetical protein
MMRKTCFCLFVMTCTLVPAIGGAWSLKGHQIIGVVAMANLPAEVPPFLRAQAAKDEIIYLQSEEDRLKIGEADEAAWTSEWTTDHYVDVGDGGMIAGVVSLDNLPKTRDAYEQALMRSTHRVDAYRIGFLPYAVLEGYEQVRSDFALWRLAAADAAAAKGDAARDAATVVKYREALIIHDIGIFSHFVGDGSQPLHVSIHYNGWGDYPNPHGFSADRRTHAQFEDDWVDRYMTSTVVMPFFQPAAQLSTIPLPEIGRYLGESVAQVVPFYELKARGGFALDDTTSDAHRDSIRFTAPRLAAASRMLDSLILTAWRTSADLALHGRE